MKCKITGKKIRSIMNFGKMPLANGFLKEKDFPKEFFYNMEIGWSDDLSLLQLNDFPSPKKMFNSNYPFLTSSSKYMVKHFAEYAFWIKKKFNNEKINIIEIGSNDGSMLKNFKNFDDNYIGFEPSKNVADHAKKNKIKTLNNFFTLENIELVKDFFNKTDVIYGANVVCHIPNINDLIKAVDKMLNSNGLFIFEEPYLGSMFDKISYDQIYDEHIYIFSATSVMKIFKIFDFELIDVLPQKTHGGSMRYVISRKGKRVKTSRLKKILDLEKIRHLDDFQSCVKFKNECEKSKLVLKNKLVNLKNKNLKICGYGATSKSTTILNYCEIGPELIDCIYDTTKDKINKFSPGMHIPIKDMAKLKKSYPNVLYLFAWNHKNEIFKKEKKFLKMGGKWVSHVNL